MKLLSILSALVLLSPAVSADDFYLGKVSEGRVISGVLINSDDGMYLIRTKGGTVGIEQKLVAKIVKSDLTIANIATQEEVDKPRLAKANADRRKIQAEERERRAAAHRAAEARRIAERLVRYALYMPRRSWSYNSTIGRVESVPRNTRLIRIR